MMKQGFSIIEHNRPVRHILFWICWVLGFTFLKSLGKPFEVYLGWFSYYLLTLPIFVVHTYLVAYVLIRYFFSRRYILLFMALFLVLFYGFSILELILSHEFIFKWYPTDTLLLEDYLSPGAVVVSGLGNLYIMLVFLAARTVRQWYMASIRNQELQQAELKLQMESTVTKMQPLMLLYAIDQIDRMVEKSSDKVTRSIALTSELLSDVMIYNEEDEPLFTNEISLVKKLVSLVSLFRENRPDVEFFISGDPGQIRLPSMILFTLIDMIFRKFADEGQIPELNIEASGFSNMISVQVLNNSGLEKDKTGEECMETLEQLRLLYREKVTISVESHTYGCSVMISKS